MHEPMSVGWGVEVLGGDLSLGQITVAAFAQSIPRL
jgi:hypothetical protein